MHWITIILIGIAANLDNLGISLAYGIKRVKIPIVSNITIALIAMFITYIAVTTGEFITDYISAKTANFFGSLLLCLIGLWTLLSQRHTKQKIAKNSACFDQDQNRIISFWEATALGFVLSANCLATGIAIGANGIPALGTVISIGSFSLLTIAIGTHFGTLLTKTLIGKYSAAISGWLLIVIGIFEMFIQ